MKSLLAIALLSTVAMAQEPKTQQVEMPIAAFKHVQKEYSTCLANFHKSAEGKSFVQVDWDQERTCDRTYRMNLRNWADAYPEAAAALALQQANRGNVVEALANNAGK